MGSDTEYGKLKQQTEQLETDISGYEMNDEGRLVDGWESDHKGRFVEQPITEREHQEK